MHLSIQQKTTLDKHIYDEIISDVNLTCLIEIPAEVLGALMANIFGRKNTILFSFIVTGITTLLCCFNTNAIPIYSTISKAIIAISFDTFFTFTQRSIRRILGRQQLEYVTFSAELVDVPHRKSINT